MGEREFHALLDRGDIRLLAQLAAAYGVELYLVGGGVRDLLLERPCQDLDFALSGAFVELPRRFAAAAGGSFFWLDEELRHGRVVLRGEGEQASYDFVPLQGGSIDADLRLRDFTVNALAISVPMPGNGLIDPHGGRDDLVAGIIRSCSPTSLADDPVRLVRAVRFAATLGFRIAGPTWDDILAHAPCIENVAAERVRDEFFRILAVPACVPYLRQLVDAGLLSRIAGTGSRAVADGLDRVERFELLAGEAERHFSADHLRLLEHVSSQVEHGITPLTLLKLALLLGPMVADDVRALAGRLRLGNRSLLLLRRLCSPKLPDGLLLAEERRTPRAMYRLFRDQSPAGPELVLLSLADGAITSEVAARLVAYYCNDYDPDGGDLYLSGADIMALLRTGPGPQVGAAAALLREAESRGEVNDREEALAFLRKNQLTNPAPMG